MSTCIHYLNFLILSVKAGKTTPEEPFNQYSAKIRESFRKEVTGQMSVKKGGCVTLKKYSENCNYKVFSINCKQRVLRQYFKLTV